MTDNIRQAISFAIRRSDDYVIQFDYRDAKGQVTRRVVSPIRFVGSDRLLGLCLCREQPRQFYLERCSRPQLMLASEVMMPMPMQAVAG